MGTEENNQILESQRNPKGIISLILGLFGYLLIAPTILFLRDYSIGIRSLSIVFTILILGLSITAIVLAKQGLKLDMQKQLTKAGFILGIILLIITILFILVNIIFWILWIST